MQDASRIGQERAGTEFSRTLVLLAGWFFLAVWLGVAGKLVNPGAPPFGIGAAVVLPLILFAIDRRLGSPLFGGFMRLDLPALIALHTFRVIGVIFIIAWWAGTLPGAFALPAGLGDIAVGLSAPFVAAAVARRRPHYIALARTWTVVGIADLVIAVTEGVLHAPAPFGPLAGSVTTDAMARYPLSLIPTFLVPMALLLHISALLRLSALTPRSS